MTRFDASEATQKWAADTAVRYALEVDAARVLMDLTRPGTEVREAAVKEFNRATERLNGFVIDAGSIWGVRPEVVSRAIELRAEAEFKG